MFCWIQFNCTVALSLYSGVFPFCSVGIEKMYRPNYRTNLSSFVKRAKYNRRKHIAQHQFFKCILILDSIGKQTHKKPLKLVCIGYNWRDVHKNALIKLKKTDFWRAMKSINSHLERIDSNTCMQLCMRMHRWIQPCAHNSVPFILFSVAIDPIQNERFGSVSFPNYIDSIYPGIIANENYTQLMHTRV